MHTPQFNRTRLAPTPSGFLHVGNVASFVITAGLARRAGAKILLRIDDLDRERVRPEYVRDIFDTLQWLDIPWDEGPRDPGEFERSHSQGHRRDLYDAALQVLREKGLLFACTCSRSQLAAEGASGYSGACLQKDIPLDTPDACWRIRTAEGVRVRMNDLHKGEALHVLPESVRHAIVRKKNGDASYQLASVVDDLHYGVDLIVRGEDLLDSTMIQLFIADVLEEPLFGSAVFHHHPLMKGADGLKLSKSAGAWSIRALMATGARPSDVFHRIARAHGVTSPIRDWQDLQAAILPAW